MLALLSTPCGGISLMLIDFVVAEGITSAEATKGHENRRMSAVALWKPSVATTGVDLFRSRGNRACGREGYSAFIVKVNV